MGVVPIVNENDTVSVSEIKFGDNDTLSAISSAIVHADYLFLLTDVQCLYTDNPRRNPDAKPVRVVRNIEQIRSQVSTSTLGTSLGTGGMSTKLIAAELATAAGVTAVVMHSSHVRDIFEVIKDGVGPSREEEAALEPEDGPLCTRFLRRETALKDRHWWIAHGLHSAGTVIIDEGAFRAVSRRESGSRLLPAGVIRTEGLFASHQAVRLVVRRRRRNHTATHHNRQSVHSVDSDSEPSRSRLTPTHSSSPIPRRPLLTPSTRSSPDFASQPQTPTIQPVLSLTSSIISLEALNRSVPPSPAIHALAESITAASLHDSDDSEALDEWEEREVGKGLAQYNSVEIDRIKGLKR